MRELPLSGPSEYSITSREVSGTGRIRRPSLTSLNLGYDDIGGAAPKVAAAQLGDWRESDYLLRLSEAVKLQFPVGGVAVTGQEMLVVHEASRSRTVRESGQNVRYGVSLRLVVEISQFDAKGSAALPVIAAQVEIGMLRASAYLEVRGYPSDKVAQYLGGTPPKFDVEGYSSYTQRVKKLQELVIGDSSSIVPVQLSVEQRPTDPDQEWGRTMGRVWGLARIADGKSASSAFKSAGSQDGPFMEGVQSAYDELSAGRAPTQSPSDDAERDAKEWIRGLSVKRRRIF